MRDIVLYLHLHQPRRVRPYSIFDIGERHDYFASYEHATDNQALFAKVAHKSYRPMIALLRRMVESHDAFSVNLSVSGIWLEQCESWDPALLHDLKELVATSKVELAAETYYHTLAFFFSRTEFLAQVTKHRKALKTHFGVEPTVFRNTELAYNNELGQWAEEAGYRAVLTEGWDPILNWRSSHYLYSPQGTSDIALFLKDYRLSDDLAFRFSNKQWTEWPLSAGTYMGWIDSLPEEEKLVNLFMDFETFGEHQWRETGIFEFFEIFVANWCAAGNRFASFSQALNTHRIHDAVDMPNTVTWADNERDLTAWLGNAMQQEAADALYRLEESVLRSEDHQLIEDWRLLQASDHLYYLSTKWLDDGNVHAYFSPYDSPYDGFLNYMNAIRDIRYRIFEHHKRTLPQGR